MNKSLTFRVYLFFKFTILLLFVNKVDAKVDSLQQIWADVGQPDSIRFNAIHGHSKKNFFSQPDSAILYASFHFALAEQKNSKKQKAIALNNRAIAYNVKGSYDNAMIDMNKVLGLFISLKDTIKIANTYNNIATTQTYLNEYHEALKYYTKGLMLYQKIKRENLQVNILMNMGLIYLTIDNNDLALDYLNKSLHICKKLGLEDIKGIIWRNISDANFQKKNYHQALNDNQKALRILEPQDQKFYIGASYSLNARIFQALNQVDSAMIYLEKALELHQEIGNYSWIWEDKIILANLMFSTDLNKATKIGEEVLKISKGEREYALKIELYDLLYRCYEKQKNYPRAIYMLENYNLYTDSLRVEQDQVEITKKVIQVEYEDKILKTKLKNEQTQSALKLSQLKKTFGILFCSAFFILFIVFYTRSKRIILNKEKEELVDKIDQLKEIENTRHQLIQSDKMASLGQLTAGVAHEINNPVNFISSGVIGLKKNLKEYIKSSKSEEKSELVEDMNYMISAIEEGVKRTSKIVQSLRLFSREDTENYIESDLIIGLESTITLLSNKLREDIFLEKDFEKEAMPICCFPGQLNQVFMNVLLNAIQAVEEGGTIKIGVKEQVENIIITIADNGPGIQDDKKQKIFEPFYTTKDVQEGTGLGLSISFGIIKKHKGSITVEDNDPKGTKFVISLPKRTGSLIS